MGNLGKKLSLSILDEYEMWFQENVKIQEGASSAGEIKSLTELLQSLILFRELESLEQTET